MSTKLKISDIEVGYGEAPVVRGVSFDVAKGDFVAVVGPNGSGLRDCARRSPLESIRNMRYNIHIMAMENVYAHEHCD
ncbi:MAG: hypothetical protein Q7T82_05775 [Armatimonadota bacterium]|nr:hypothetical protein [Armatimonadota bacterium]